MMVRTLKQYMFVYDVLFEALITNHAVVGEDVNVNYRILNRVDTRTNRSYFHEQFKACFSPLFVHIWRNRIALNRDLGSATVHSSSKLCVFYKFTYKVKVTRVEPHMFNSRNNLFVTYLQVDDFVKLRVCHSKSSAYSRLAMKYCLYLLFLVLHRFWKNLLSCQVQIRVQLA
jgi:hypothetical protein